MKILTRDEINSLTAPERLAMIGDLWDSLTDAELPPAPAQMAELERRLSNFDQDVKSAVTWDALKAELASRAR